jgi:holo-[acyl-carrier protein] synthase
MISSIGSSLQSVEELRADLESHPERRDALFTPVEIAYCERKRYPVVHLAARLAAKRAAYQAIGIEEGPWLDVEVSNDTEGRPTIQFTGRVAELAVKGKLGRPLLSMSHTKALAAAIVVFESEPSSL